MAHRYEFDIFYLETFLLAPQTGVIMTSPPLTAHYKQQEPIIISGTVYTGCDMA